MAHMVKLDDLLERDALYEKRISSLEGQLRYCLEKKDDKNITYLLDTSEAMKDCCIMLTAKIDLLQRGLAGLALAFFIALFFVAWR